MRGLSHAGQMSTEPATYPGYRFPAEVIQHAVWLYHLFSLSLRDIELILAERGVVVSQVLSALVPDLTSCDEGRVPPTLLREWQAHCWYGEGEAGDGGWRG